MKKILDHLMFLEKIAAGLFIAILTVLVLGDVLSRELFKIGFPWAQKSAVYLMVWAGFLGAVIMSHKNEHLRPEIGEKIFKGKSLIYLKRLNHFLTGLFNLGAAYFSFLYIQESKEFGDMNVILNVPVWWLQIILPYCFFSMSLRSLFYFIYPDFIPTSEAKI